jgi:S-adenosylmethionine hydrolase
VRRTSPVVTLLSDFGSADGFVGAMKGVIASGAPDARILDITHEIAPGDVRAAAFALEAAARFFPPRTVHVAVVDPGVGTARRALAIEAAGQTFVGPDNGLLALAARGNRRIFVLDAKRFAERPSSATFHGRDVFAPAAAKLARGVLARRLGDRGEDMIELELPTPRRRGAALLGEVVHADRFGNLMTNVSEAEIRSLTRQKHAELMVEVGSRRISGGLARTYGERGAGELLALVNSSGRLEIARRDGSAAAMLKFRAGRRMTVRCAVADRG